MNTALKLLTLLLNDLTFILDLLEFQFGAQSFRKTD